MSTQTQTQTPVGAPQTQINEIEKKIARKLIEDREILISLAEVEDVVVETLGDVDDVDEVVERLPLHKVYDGFCSEDTLFLFLPPAITDGKDVKNAVSAIELLLRANFDTEDVGYNTLATIIANILYEEFAKWDEKRDDAMAWYHGKLAVTYKVYDEVVDKISANTYAGPIYYKIGDTWVCARWDYCNYDRWGNSVGIQKCVTYSYASPE